MKVILLGTGTSTGIPEVGCGCPVCHSADPRDRRLRTSALVITDSGHRILIDCGPDFHYQATRLGIDRIDAILLTHEHYDHTFGLDDVRTIAWREDIPIYGQQRVLDSVKARMHYVFSPNPYPGTPRFKLHPIEEGVDASFELFGERVTPISLAHGALPIVGYRIGPLSYITDMKSIELEEWAKVSGSQLLVVNALRYQRPHPSHQSIQDVERLLPRLSERPELTLLTHLSHHAPSHAQISALLPTDLQPAYDFEYIEVDEAGVRVLPLPAYREPYTYRDLGRIAYAEAWALQKELFEAQLDAKHEGRATESFLLFCEHNPVFTMGKHADEANMLMSEDFLREHGYDFFSVERGGDVTYHGPGQITGYPILDLEQFGLGLKAYIDLLEQSVIELLRFYRIDSTLKAGATGVWLDVGDPVKERKICAIGVKSSRYVTMHGFALNVNTDLAPFHLINPCGFKDGKVTSIAEELGKEVDMTVAKHMLASILHRRLAELLPPRF